MGARSSPFLVTIRDDNCRLLVKRRYSVYFLSKLELEYVFPIENMFNKPDMVILRISQAISREAQEILYSESSLRYGMNFGKTLSAGEAPDPTTQAVSRTKKVIVGLTSKTNIPGYYETDDIYRPRTASTCKATIDKLMGTHILRDTCHLEFCAFEPSMIEKLSNHILPTLKAFNEIRTILVLIDLEAVFEKRVQREEFKKKGSKGKALARVEKIIQAIIIAMEPTLGPAVTSDGTFRICLINPPT